jgi:hypothetical protein
VAREMTSLKLVAFFGAIAVVVLLRAFSAGPADMYAFLVLTAAFCVVSALTRRDAFGGWLLFYLLGVYGNLVITWVFLSAPLVRFDPARWDDKALYILFLTTTIPDLAALCAQAGLSFWLIRRRRSDNVSLLRYLKFVLLGDLLFSLLALPLDIRYWPSSVWWDVYSILWPLVWLLYFARSKRVQRVFIERDWGLQQE